MIPQGLKVWLIEREKATRGSGWGKGADQREKKSGKEEGWAFALLIGGRQKMKALQMKQMIEIIMGVGVGEEGLHVLLGREQRY